MGPKSIRPERVVPNPPEKPNEEEKPEERAEDADGKDEFEMTIDSTNIYVYPEDSTSSNNQIIIHGF